MKKFISPIITALFFTSCVEIYYPAPQPEFAKELTEIPEKFQGEFWRIKAKTENVISDSSSYIVSENTIIMDGDTLDDEQTVFKSWGNYFFLNQRKDSVSDYWSCYIIHTNGLKGDHEKITYKKLFQESIDWTYFDLEETEDGDNNIYIKQLSTLQFLYLLRMSQSHDENFEIHRIK
ncbi:MAG: hypothetical protein HOH88_06350 [Flavobacteriales bacterium]|jgi:hypothetical protein|nr:hypothetical protein [Flavobacteriales bacterium]